MRQRHHLTAILFAAGLLCAGAAAARPAGEPGSKTAEVDVFVGTGGDGHTFPGATRPSA